MNATPEPKSMQNGLLILLCCAAVLACSGCATYFRTGELGYEEIKERHDEQVKEKKLMLPLGTFFGSWKL
jgi:ferredoxin